MKYKIVKDKQDGFYSLRRTVPTSILEECYDLDLERFVDHEVWYSADADVKKLHDYIDNIEQRWEVVREYESSDI